MGRRPRRWLTSPALALFLFLASLYVLTGGGHLYSYDEETMFALTESLVERGSIEAPLCGGCPVLTSTPGADGRNYSRYGPLQSIVAVPFYLAGRTLAGDDPQARWFLTRFAVSLLNPFVTAAIAALLYRFVRCLGYRPAVAITTALLYGLGTQAWPRAKTFFSEPLTTVLILGAVFCWHQLDRRGQGTGDRGQGVGDGGWEAGGRGAGQFAAAGWAAAIGVCCGLAITTKWGAAIVLPPLGLAGAATLARAWRSGALSTRGAVTTGLSAALALGVPLAALGLYNWLRFASPLETGYGTAEVGAVQSGDFRTALHGFLISPGKSIFLFSPVVVLGLLAWFPFARRHRSLALVCGGLALTHLLFYARVPNWDGGVCWGPRYLDFVLPLLVLPLASGVAWLASQPPLTRRLFGALALSIVGAAIVVQLLGVLVNFDTGYNSVTVGPRYRALANSPPLVHARILGDRVSAWVEVRFPREDGVTLGRGFPLLTETDPPWPRFLPVETRLHVRAGGDLPVVGTLVYQDARDQREPPQRLTILVDGRPAEGRTEAPAPDSADPAAYRITFTIRPAGGRGTDFTVTVRNDGFADLGPNRLLDLRVTLGEVELATRRRPLILPFPGDRGGRFAWFITERNVHLVDLWPWYVAVLKLRAGLAPLLIGGVGGTATLGLILGLAGLWRTRGATRATALVGGRAWPRAGTGTTDQGGDVP